MASFVWCQGRVQPMTEAVISVADRGFLLADGVFETIAVQQGEVQRWSRHWQRLCHGCEVLRMPVPEVSAVMQAVNAVLQANAIGEGACRITYSRGVGERGLLPPACPQPTLVVSVAAAGKELPPARLVLCRTTRRNEASALSRCKTLNYGDGLLARMEAESRGADDAVLLNSQGRVAESSISSLFYRWEGQWWTPPVEEGALPGVRRAELIAAGMVRERPLSVSELDQVAAMILGNALSLRAVSEWEGRGVNLAVAQEVVACWTRG